MYKYLFLLLGPYLHLSYAIVPTLDQHQFSDDITTTVSYGASLGVYLAELGQAMTAAQQISQLHGLQQVSAAGKAICDLCTPSDIHQLHTYVNQVNGDLCSQFSFAMQNVTGLLQSTQDINDIILLLQTNPKAAGLALQQAAIRTQAASQNSLTQVQLLMAQQSQKGLAEQKLEQQSNSAVYAGFKNSGL